MQAENCAKKWPRGFRAAGLSLRRSFLAELRWPEGPPNEDPYSYGKQNGNPWVDFLVVIMATSIARGRVRRTTTTTVESRKMAVILQILQIIGWQRHAALVYCVLHWYWTSMLWSIDTSQSKVSADHIAGSSLPLIEVKCFFEVDRWPSAGFLIGSRAHVWLTYWKQGRIVRKPVNANQD